MSVHETSVDDLATARDTGDVTLIDVRGTAEYAEAHIPGAHHIPLDDLTDRLAEVPTGRRIHVVCQSGRRSAQAAELLGEHGYDDVVSVAGGTNAWQESGRPVETSTS